MQENTLFDPKIAKILYFILSGSFLFWILIQDLSGKYYLDYSSYLKHFRNDHLNYFNSLFFNKKPFFLKILSYFTEEYLWAKYTFFLSFLMPASYCIKFTTLLLNFLLILTFKKTKHPILFLFLWILIPDGFVTVGLVQIRQGLAFSVFLYLALVFSKPRLGAFLASLIHTTFFIPFFVLLLHKFIKTKKMFIFFLVSFLIFSELISAFYFNLLAGRRSIEYAINFGENNVRFLIGMIILVIPTVYTMKKLTIWPPILVGHFGVFVWVFSCYFFLSVGMSRVSYYMLLFLIPLLETWKVDKNIMWYYPVIFFYLFYLIINNAINGAYNILF